MIGWIKKKFENRKLSKIQKIEKEVFSFLKNPHNTINDKFIKLITYKDFLNPNDYKKWDYLLRHYEELNGIEE